jgi:hypothetical protein
MAGGRKRKMQQLVRQEIATVNPFSAQHGDYSREPLPVTTGELGSERSGNITVLRNRSVTTVERWSNGHLLSRPQKEAIELYHRAWSVSIGHPNVTMNWSLTATIRGIPAEVWLTNRMEARETLRRIDDLLKRMPNGYADVWKNVILFDEPLGVAGSRLGYEKQASAANKARKICQFIGDKIAEMFRL